MAEILALGISHYPPLWGPDERMAWILRRMLQNPKLPAALRTPDGWPEPMRAEWGDDEGRSAAARHRETLVSWLAETRAALDAFKPDLVLMWGDDQYENFKEDVVPPYCIAAYDRIKFATPPGNVWGETDKVYDLSGHRTAAKLLATRLIEQGFDTAYAYKPLHHSLGHAFANAILYLDYDRRGFDYPVVPFAINCYGRKVLAQRGGLPTFDREIADADLDPPAPTPRRLFDLGAATARILADSPYRVALLASSSWSHAFLTAKNNFLWPDAPADRRLYQALKDGDWTTWRSLTGAEVEASGQQEVLNWSCLAGALSELGRKPQRAGFVDTWIFNSSKVFLIAAA
ncbi:MAG: extradiol ring-cleavage dioxygenase [Alphaproteobacteria bacterium]|nr:extradiol ring-cleavage dioxygenase [Alphaproteobacteria bacterium]